MQPYFLVVLNELKRQPFCDAIPISAHIICVLIICKLFCNLDVPRKTGVNAQVFISHAWTLLRGVTPGDLN